MSGEVILLGVVMAACVGPAMLSSWKRTRLSLHRWNRRRRLDRMYRAERSRQRLTHD